MKNQFIPLENDDDVILIKEDTFQVCKLKEIVKKEMERKMYTQVYQTNNQGQPGAGSYIHSFLTGIVPNANTTYFNVIQFNYFADCQVLKTNGKGWQKGQINIKIRVFTDGKKHNEVDLWFCPEESNIIESPLDDMRKMILTEE